MPTNYMAGSKKRLLAAGMDKKLWPTVEEMLKTSYRNGASSAEPIGFPGWGHLSSEQVEAALRVARWWRKWPEFVPSPDHVQIAAADIQAMRDLIDESFWPMLAKAKETP